MLHWPEQGDPELFLKYNYPETKDLCKHFLTLVVAVLVFSLTLSEKVVGFQHASWTARSLLGGAWALMLVAVIACGVGLTYITMAAGDAVYLKSRYLQLAARSYSMIVLAGLCFIVGLTLLILTALITAAAPG